MDVSDGLNRVNCVKVIFVTYVLRVDYWVSLFFTVLSAKWINNIL